jgi:TRAP-type C4-dicarboxylate transport system substrate-binding protein
MEYQWDYAEKLESEIIEGLKSKGMEVVTLSSDELAAFKVASAPAITFLEGSVGAEIYGQFIDAAQRAESGQ